MSHEEFDDNCPGCRPAILDVETGQVLPETHPIMMAANRVWANATIEERKAFHNVTCLNSRDRKDLELAYKLTEAIKKSLDN
jgi:hypothetical protein